ncbi:uncharacterized protein (TIGR00369 family) [Jatrophihabitans sp. GAS493]|uniref:PaaI family thioesterase n=1 Tax=Jatrophihabitans sp. GAS493 TaxID=1907575 RepID=UPI000BB7802A|nr:PaaI family thioesterase [Jatrophihabitans sp. GAS493]SOD71471.1 uncharacterized protein (TIGR00369 family) [Jatrophihabitans sp. GAS493]
MSGRTLRNLGEERARRNTVRGLWRTLGYELESWEVGRAVVSWTATEEYGFAAESGYVVQGGLVTAVLDAAMGSACWTVLDQSQIFLTADLRVEFLRSTRVGALRATGTVVRSTPRVVFCAGELHDADGTLLAASRCTQVVLPADHPGSRSLTGS